MGLNTFSLLVKLDHQSEQQCPIGLYAQSTAVHSANWVKHSLIHFMPGIKSSICHLMEKAQRHVVISCQWLYLGNSQDLEVPWCADHSECLVAVEHHFFFFFPTRNAQEHLNFLWSPLPSPAFCSTVG